MMSDSNSDSNYAMYLAGSRLASARRWYPIGDGDDNMLYTVDCEGCIDVHSGEGPYLIQALNERGRQIIRAGDWIVLHFDCMYRVVPDDVFRRSYRKWTKVI